MKLRIVFAFFLFASLIFAESVNVTFTYQTGGGIPAAQIQSISSTNPSAPVTGLFLTVTNGSYWLAASLDSTSTPANLTISVNPIGLSMGFYAGSVEVSAAGTSNSLVFLVTLNVLLNPTSNGTLLIVPYPLTLDYQLGSSSTILIRTLTTASSSRPIHFTVSSSTPWITVIGSAPNLYGPGWTGITPDSVTVFVDVTGLPVALHRGLIVFRSVEADSSEFDVEVDLNVTSTVAPVMQFSTRTLYFESIFGGPPPPAQSLQVKSSLPDLIDYNVRELWWTTIKTNSHTWEGTTPTGGAGVATPATFQVEVNPSALHPITGKPFAPGLHVNNLMFTNSMPPHGPVEFVSVELLIREDVNPVITTIANAASYSADTSAKSWLAIFGKNFASIPAPGREWRGDEIIDGLLPTSLEGVSVRIDNKLAPMSFVGPNQVNVQVPDDDSLGSVAVEVTGPNGTARSSVILGSLAPALFAGPALSGIRHAAAVHLDGSPVGRPEVIAKATPARPGEVIVLFGTGFGRTDPDRPTGRVIDPAPLAEKCSVRMGGVPAVLLYAGVISPGLYQFNVEVPKLPSGDQAVVIEIHGSVTQDGIRIDVQE